MSSNLLRIIHSGGQTGADQGGLAAGKELRLETGGMAPRFYRVEDGFAPELALEYGLDQHDSHRYPPRTKFNVKNTDGTLLFGNKASAGSRLTANYAGRIRRPLFHVRWVSGEPLPGFEVQQAFRDWIVAHDIMVLNVAGNRESSQPGIFEATRDFIVAAAAGGLKQW